MLGAAWAFIRGVGLRFWVDAAIVLAILAGLWFVYGAIQRKGYKAGAAAVQLTLETERAQWAAERASAAQASAEWQKRATEAERAARATEVLWLTAARAIDHDGQIQIEKQRAAAGRAGAALIGLREQLGAVVADAARAAEAGASAADARERQAAAEAARVSAELLGRCHERSIARAGYGDAAAAAGARCERWVDTLTEQR